MAEVVEDIIETFETSNETSAANTDPIPKRTPVSTESMMITYVSIVVMALVPVFLGSFRSLRLHVLNKIKKKLPESLTAKYAMMIPLMASGTLLTLYFIIKVFSKEQINLILNTYFYVLGVAALNNLLRNPFSTLLPKSIPKTKYKLQFIEGDGENKHDKINIKFTLHGVICFISCATLGIFYLYTKHWIANNIFGMAFAINGIEFIHLNNITIGCILLCGLFVYDIFWVFGTNVMMTVAESFDAPIKLIFPRDIFENGIFGSNSFAILGLGDIVIPGIFIAFLLRFDQSLKRKTNLYFNTTFFAYFLGLLTTEFVVHVFKVAQPALLYLVPACLITPILLALIRGDLKALFSYEDHNIKSKNSSKTKQID